MTFKQLKNFISKHKTYFLIGLIILVGFVSYINIYKNEFLWDDEFLVQRNEFIRDFKYLPTMFTIPTEAGAGSWNNFYRPMHVVAYSIVYYFGGAEPFGFHLLNVLLHLANAVLIFFLIKKIFQKKHILPNIHITPPSPPCQGEHRSCRFFDVSIMGSTSGSHRGYNIYEWHR